MSSFQEKCDGRFLLATCEYCLTKHVVENVSPDRLEPERIYETTCPYCRRMGFHASSELEWSDHRPKIPPK